MVQVGRLRTRLIALLRNERGVAAVEFGLFAPILFLSLLATVDLGFGITQRMTMEHILRAGAQQAMADLGVANVLATIKSSAEARFTVCASWPSTSPTQFCPNVSVSCECPNGTAVDCTALTGCAATYLKYYTIKATMTHKTMILPIDLAFEPSLMVQAH